MSLKVSDLVGIMEEYAPPHLKESYDNVGLMIGDLESSVTSILVALDCTLEVINEAKNRGCNMIVTHHPLFFIRPYSITKDSLLGTKVMELIKSGINVYSSHTNLDVVEGGLNDIAAELLGFKEWEVIEPLTVSGGGEKAGVGRLIVLSEALPLVDLCSRVKKSLGISNLRYAGKDSMFVKKIAVINGSGKDYFDASKRKGADCIITGDTSYHYVSDFVEQGIAIIDAGHFETEWPAMKVAAKALKAKISLLGYDNSVLLAESSISPYKVI